MAMKKAVRKGDLSREFFTPTTPEEYFSTMSDERTYIDEIFLIMIAALMETDIIVIYFHERCGPGPFQLVRGGPLNKLPAESGPNPPIFLGKYI